MVIENDLGSIGNWGSIGLLCRSCGAGRWPTLNAGCRSAFPNEKTSLQLEPYAESLLYFGKHVHRHTLVKKEFEIRTL